MAERTRHKRLSSGPGVFQTTSRMLSARQIAFWRNSQVIAVGRMLHQRSPLTRPRVAPIRAKAAGRGTRVAPLYPIFSDVAFGGHCRKKYRRGMPTGALRRLK